MIRFDNSKKQILELGTIVRQAQDISSIKIFLLKYKDELDPIKIFRDGFIVSIHAYKIWAARYFVDYLKQDYRLEIINFQDYEDGIFRLNEYRYNLEILKFYFEELKLTTNKPLSYFVGWSATLAVIKYMVEVIGLDPKDPQALIRVSHDGDYDAAKYLIEEHGANNLREAFLAASKSNGYRVVKYLVEERGIDSFYEALVGLLSYFFFDIKKSSSHAEYLITKGNLKLENTNIITDIFQQYSHILPRIESINFALERGAILDTSSPIIGKICYVLDEQSWHRECNEHILLIKMLELGVNPNQRFLNLAPIQILLSKNFDSYDFQKCLAPILIAGADITDLSQKEKNLISKFIPEKVLKYQQEIFQKSHKIFLNIKVQNIDVVKELANAFDNSYKQEGLIEDYAISVKNALAIIKIKEIGLSKYFFDGSHNLSLKHAFLKHAAVYDRDAIYKIKILMLAQEFKVQELDCDHTKVATVLLYFNSEKHNKDSNLSKTITSELKSKDQITIWPGSINIDLYTDPNLETLRHSTLSGHYAELDG